MILPAFQCSGFGSRSVSTQSCGNGQTSTKCSHSTEKCALNCVQTSALTAATAPFHYSVPRSVQQSKAFKMHIYGFCGQSIINQMFVIIGFAFAFTAFHISGWFAVCPVYAALGFGKAQCVCGNVHFLL